MPDDKARPPDTPPRVPSGSDADANQGNAAPAPEHDTDDPGDEPTEGAAETDIVMLNVLHDALQSRLVDHKPSAALTKVLREGASRSAADGETTTETPTRRGPAK